MVSKGPSRAGFPGLGLVTSFSNLLDPKESKDQHSQVHTENCAWCSVFLNRCKSQEAVQSTVLTTLISADHRRSPRGLQRTEGNTENEDVPSAVEDTSPASLPLPARKQVGTKNAQMPVNGKKNAFAMPLDMTCRPGARQRIQGSRNANVCNMHGFYKNVLECVVLGLKSGAGGFFQRAAPHHSRDKAPRRALPVHRQSVNTVLGSTRGSTCSRWPLCCMQYFCPGRGMSWHLVRASN